MSGAGSFDATKYTFFINGFLSNWYPCSFMDTEGITYNCMEQYMMYQKAMLFGDKETALKILAADHPGVCKRLGRQVRDFEPKRWDFYKFRIVCAGCYLKFSQSSSLRNKLFNTGNTILVECNPDDRIWGIGKSMNDPYLSHTEEWGENLLGEALMSVRAALRGEMIESVRTD